MTSKLSSWWCFCDIKVVTVMTFPWHQSYLCDGVSVTSKLSLWWPFHDIKVIFVMVFLWHHSCHCDDLSIKLNLSLRWHFCDITVVTAQDNLSLTSTQIAKFMGPTWGPPGSSRPQMGPKLAPWTLISGKFITVTVVIFLWSTPFCLTHPDWQCNSPIYFEADISFY